MENLYHILEVSSSAKPAEIKRAYFRLAKKYHPDAGRSQDIEQFKLIAQAYKILSNPLERAVYDQGLKKEPTPEQVVDNFVRDHTYAADASAASDPRILRKQERELRQYRRRLILKALFYILLVSIVASLMGGGMVVLFKFLLERATGEIFSRFYELGGLLAGLVLGLILSLDHHFDLESYLSFKYQHLVKHLRVFLFTLAIGFFATLCFGWLLAVFNVQGVVPAVTTLSLALLFAATISADGHFWERVRDGKFFALFMLLLHNLLKGLIGALLGGLIAVSLYLIFRRPEILWQFAFCGYALTILFGSRAPETIDQLNQITQKPMKSVLYLFALLAMLATGFFVGIYL